MIYVENDTKKDVFRGMGFPGEHTWEHSDQVEPHYMDIV